MQGSQITHGYFHHADDVIKMSASNSVWADNTVLHGNTGSVVLIGDFGKGLIDGGVENSIVDGIYVHYLWMNSDEAQGSGTHTGIVGTETCLPDQGDTLSFVNNTIKNVVVLDLGRYNANENGNDVNMIPGEMVGSTLPLTTTLYRAFAIGTLDSESYFCQVCNYFLFERSRIVMLKLEPPLKSTR